jgi:hypothetical protein
LETLPGNRQCLYTTGCFGGGDERLWIFDPEKSIENGEAFQPLAYIGTTFLSNAFDGRDRVYFVQYNNLEEARTHWSEAVRDYPQEDIDFEDTLHLRSISIAADGDRAVTDHGEIVDEENRRVTMVESLAADRKGNVYMQGTWNSLSEEESSHQYVWSELTDYYAEMGYTPLLKTYEGAKDYEYRVMHRGQFFSCGNVAKDTGAE